jgi:hypothetical protein
MEKENILFKTSSPFRTIFIFLMRVFCVIGIINCVSDFNENRILISIVIFLLVVLFLTISNQVVIVYNNHIEYNSKRIVPYLSTYIKIPLEDIQIVNTKLRLTLFNSIITTLIPFIPSSTIAFNTLIIEQKEQKPTTIVTKIYKDQIIKALKVMEEQTNNKIKIIYN